MLTSYSRKNTRAGPENLVVRWRENVNGGLGTKSALKMCMHLGMIIHIKSGFGASSTRISVSLTPGSHGAAKSFCLFCFAAAAAAVLL